MRSYRSTCSGSFPQRRLARAAQAAIEGLESRLFLSASVLQYRYDSASGGVNDAEVQLTPQNVKTATFGKLSTTPLDGQVYTEPLVQSGVTIASGVNTVAGATGVHNVVFVATENDTLYAIDAGGGQILWNRSFTTTTNSGGNLNNPLGATAVTTLTSAQVGAPDISPVIGITSTPVIDASTGILYVVVKTRETINGGSYSVQRVHAIHIANGTDATAPYLLGTTINGNTNNTQIYAYGTGDGHVTDPYNGTGKQVVQFNALRENQRTALSLVNNQLYIAWASHGDNGPYHGWLVTLNVANVTTSGLKLSGVLCTSPNDGEAGIWAGGGAVEFDPDGSGFYFMTGNGTGGAPTLNAQGFPTDANYNEAVVKAKLDSSTSATNQGPNGWGIKIVDYFIPYNVVAMDAADSDFGSGAPELLPASAGITGHPNLLVTGGKDGRVYVLDRDNLGHYTSNGDPHALNSVLNKAGNLTPPDIIAGTLSTPVYYNGKLYLTSGYAFYSRAYTISSAGQLVSASQTAIGSFGILPGGPTVSADGANDGIVWIMDRNANEIHAYDANSLSTELWNSNEGSGNSLGAVVKFAEPTVVNGEVYVGTTNSLVVYGLKQAPAKVPNAPVLSATTLSGSSINLTWTDSSVSPNTASAYLIEESTDEKTFTQVATAPAGATSIAIGGLKALSEYDFRIRGVDSAGNSAYSNVAAATTNNQSSGIDFSGGFGAAAGQFTLNGKAALKSGDLQLTDTGTNEASSAFYNTPVDITNFSSQFTFQLTAGTSTADGFTFTLQNKGLTALGSLGGGLGYGPVNTGGAIGITKSVMVKFDLYNNAGEGVDSTGLFTNGVSPSNSAQSINLAPTGIDLHSGDLFQVNLAYDGTTLTEKITDTKTGKSATESYVVNIASIVQSNTALAGFTGGDGGRTALQNILTWTYAPSAATSPNTPVGLGATPATATSVSLTWTNAATNQTGYHLDRATDSGFTQNLITETLPANPASFTDITTGLAPGNTYYYQLRAFNSAGDSGDSNVASVTIPLAPPTPTDQMITNVTSSEIDITWEDNAGHLASGYNILRAVNHGSFSVVAQLPPTSRPAPSGYGWNDTSVAAGNYYEYHIEAVNTSGNNDFAGVNATTLTAAPNPSAIPGDGSVTLSWPAVTGAVSYNVYRGTTAGGESATPFATGITTTSYQDTTVTNGIAYFYEVTAVNGNASYMPPLPSESAFSKEVTATPGAGVTNTVPLFTSSIDIGSPALPGSASFSGGTYTVTGAGTDIWNTSDQFHYASTNVTGDTTIAATVTSVQNTYAWAKAGVMIRDGTAANAAFADVVVTPGGYLAFQYRTKAGGSCAQTVLTGLEAPQSVKLIRTGNSFSAFYSTNGTTWIQLGNSVTITMGSAVTAGLAVTSINTTKTCTATFTNVSVG